MNIRRIIATILIAATPAMGGCMATVPAAIAPAKPVTEQVLTTVPDCAQRADSIGAATAWTDPLGLCHVGDPDGNELESPTDGLPRALQACQDFSTYHGVPIDETPYDAHGVDCVFPYVQSEQVCEHEGGIKVGASCVVRLSWAQLEGM